MHSAMHKDNAPRPRKRPRTSDRDTREKQSSLTPICNAKSGRFVVHIARDPKIQAQRSQLPVFMHEQEIVEALRHNDVVIITGATGSGKTTQVPQFLLEEGLGDPRSAGQSGMIVVTQPRRVAAITCAKRVANETGAPVGRMVGYQVRHKASVSNATRLKFVTDGVLLRETEDDLLLTKYSAVVIDEAHERTLNTDLLLALLSRTVVMRRADASPERAPLKLIIMSATLDVKGVFVGPGSLFPNAPVVEVPARQFPVTVHFARVTPTDYVEEALRKVRKIHRRLPPGGVLVFVSGRREVEELCAKIGDAFKDKKVKVEGSNVMLGVKVLPFFALLPEAQQHLVFEDFGEGVRKIVIATNIAETSVTIPGISYVVDTGKVKEQVYRGSGAGLLSSFQVQWVCKASAEQRTGRAGRTGPGHAYRLYSSAVFDQQFQEFREAEVRRVPADAIVLRLRSLGILHVDKFPFPTKPDAKALLDAQALLERIGALQSGKRNVFALSNIEGHDIEDDGEANAGVMLGVTRIGRELSKIPAPPRFARMIVAARSCAEILPHICRIAAMLSVGSVLDRSSREGMSKQSVFSHPQSDILTQLKAICAAEDAGWAASNNGRKRNDSAVREFCKKYSLHFKTTMEILATADQLEETLAKCEDQEYEHRCEGIAAPSPIMETCIIRAMLCGFPDKIARRLSRDEAAAVGVPSRWCGSAFGVGGCSEPVFLQSGSSVRLHSDLQYVIFGQLVRTGHERKARGGGSTAKGINEGTKEEVNHEADRVESEDEYEEWSMDNMEATVEAVYGGSEAVVGAQGMKREEDVGRIVMENVSAISSTWVAQNAATMCEYSAHKAFLQRERGAAGAAVTGLCTYDPKRDAVLVTLTSSYGSQQWKMGSTRVRYRLAMRLLAVHEEERTLEAVRSAGSIAFANALVNGDVNCVAGLGATITARGDRGTGSSVARQVAAALRTRDVMSVRELQAHAGEADESFLSEFLKISK